MCFSYETGIDCEFLDRDSLRGLGQAVCIAYETSIRHGQTVTGSCFHDTTKCVRRTSPFVDTTADMNLYGFEFDVLLAEEELLKKLQEFIKSSNWNVFQSVVEREFGPGLPEQLEGMRIVDAGVNSLQTGTEEGPLEDQRRQGNEPSCVAELRLSLLALPDDAFHTGKILAPNINFLERVSAAMSKAMDDHDIDDFIVLRMIEVSHEDRMLAGSEGEEVTLHVLVDCDTREEAQRLETKLEELPSSEIQREFEEQIEGVEKVEVVGIDLLYEDSESEAPSSGSSSKSFGQSKGLLHLEFAPFYTAGFLLSLLFEQSM